MYKDFLSLSLTELKNNRDATKYVENIIKRLPAPSVRLLLDLIMTSLTTEFKYVLNHEDSILFSKYIECQNKIDSYILMLRFTFLTFFNQIKGRCAKQLEIILDNIGLRNRDPGSIDFRYLYASNLINKTWEIDEIQDEMIHSVHDFITSEIYELFLKFSSACSTSIELFYASGLYDAYFTLFSVYESLINYYILVGPNRSKDASVRIINRYNNLRDNLSKYLVTVYQDINIILRSETDMFNNSIDFLSRLNVVNFENKKRYFRKKIQEMNPYKDGRYKVGIKREQLVEDSVMKIMKKTPTEFFNNKLHIQFLGEEGEDQGGLTREWIDLLLIEITNPKMGLFSYTSDSKASLLPSRNSKKNPDYILYFNFIGRVLAKAIIDQITVDLKIDKSVYKYILGRKRELSDLEAIDPQYYKSLVWIKENQLENSVSLTFSIEYDEFGETKLVDLKTNGKNIHVTDQNKSEYIDLIFEFKLLKDMEEQIKSIRQGMIEIIDVNLLSIFNEEEFELLIGGIPDIDVEDWMINTEYKGYTSKSPCIIWFWKTVRTFNAEERVKLLHFCTGSNRVPFEGFSNLQGNNGLQKFSIYKSGTGDGDLPTAHTCINRLVLPEYKSFRDLRKSLLYAINECFEGFGFV